MAAAEGNLCTYVGLHNESCIKPRKSGGYVTCQEHYDLLFRLALSPYNEKTDPLKRDRCRGCAQLVDSLSFLKGDKWFCSPNCPSLLAKAETKPGKIDGQGVKGSMFKLKLPVDLVPPLFIRMVALVLLFGARKYEKNNWMKGMSWSELAAGTIRHIQDFLEGKEYDKESGLPHLAHAACGLMFLIWYAYGPNRAKYRVPELDDRTYQWVDENGKSVEDPWEKEVDRINNIDFSAIKVPTKGA